MIAYFLPRVWQWVKGIVPTYWPVKVFWMLAEGEADWWPYLAIAALYQSLILVLLLRRFGALAGRQGP